MPNQGRTREPCISGFDGSTIYVDAEQVPDPNDAKSEAASFQGEAWIDYAKPERVWMTELYGDAALEVSEGEADVCYGEAPEGTGHPYWSVRHR